MADANLNDPALRARAVAAAQGKQPFDIVLQNVRILDMVTGRERRAEIGLVGALIASVQPPGELGAAQTHIDGGNAFALPGLIDTHMHIESSMITPAEYATAVLPTGVTTAVWDPHEFANACGVAGVDYAIDSVRDLQLRVLTLAPTCVPSAPGFESSGGDFGPDTLADLLNRAEIHGSAELMTMQPLLNGDPRVTGIVEAALASQKRICGHARGLEGGALAAYAAAGVETDHELTSEADLIARLENGMTVELRGSHEHLLHEFAKALLNIGHMPQTVTLCTDDVFPDDLLAKGGLVRLIRLLIQHGLPADWVYRAATLNGANRIGRKDLGLIAPGKRADIVLIPDLETALAENVFADGVPVARGRKLTVTQTTIDVPDDLRNTMHLAPLHPSDFEITAQGRTANVSTLSKPRFPEWGQRVIAVEEGKIVLPKDMARMAVINRYGSGTPARLALLENWGSWSGAFASSVSHDSHNLTVFGRDPHDMAIAANAVRDMEGGLAVVQNGEVTASISLPVAGLVSERGLETVAADFAAVRKATDELVEWAPPYLVFKALFGASLVCNAGPRLSDMGLVDPFEGDKFNSCAT